MTIKRVALITPPYHSGVVESAGTWLNVGFVYIAGSLRAAGYEVDYYDAMSLGKVTDIKARIEAFKPDVIAITSFTASIIKALELCDPAEYINPAIVTVLGNVHAAFCYDEILKDHNDTLDYIVRGEGEVTLVELLDCLNAGGDPVSVNGLAFWRGETVVVTPKAAYIHDLDNLPPPGTWSSGPSTATGPRTMPAWRSYPPPAAASPNAPSVRSSDPGPRPGAPVLPRTSWLRSRCWARPTASK